MGSGTKVKNLLVRCVPASSQLDDRDGFTGESYVSSVMKRWSKSASPSGEELEAQFEYALWLSPPEFPVDGRHLGR
jgi:hypothetical protein